MSILFDSPKKQKPLSSVESVKAAKPGEHMVTGSPGLILRVHTASGGALTRSWIARVTVNGQRRRLGLGQYPGVGLADARKKAQEARQAVDAGIDPSVSAKRARRVAEEARTLTLGAAIDAWLAIAPSYKNVRSAEIREHALRVRFASLYARDVVTITAADVAAVLRPLTANVAAKAHAAARSAFDYAATMLEPHGVTVVNPCDPRRLRSVGWMSSPKSESLAAIDWRIAPEVAANLASATDAVSACALLILATCVRAGTARLAKWADIDFDKRTWTPPFADLKDGKHHKRPFIVPLSDAALGVLEAMHGRHSRYVFGQLTDQNLVCLTRRLRRRHPSWTDPESGKPFVIHGFRASFRTFVEEVHRGGSSLGELSLGHKVHGDVASRYIRTGLVEERRALLDAWSRHLRGEAAEVIAFPVKA